MIIFSRAGVVKIPDILWSTKDCRPAKFETDKPMESLGFFRQAFLGSLNAEDLRLAATDSTWVSKEKYKSVFAGEQCPILDSNINAFFQLAFRRPAQTAELIQRHWSLWLANGMHLARGFAENCNLGAWRTSSQIGVYEFEKYVLHLRLIHIL